MWKVKDNNDDNNNDDDKYLIPLKGSGEFKCWTHNQYTCILTGKCSMNTPRQHKQKEEQESYEVFMVECT